MWTVHVVLSCPLQFIVIHYLPVPVIFSMLLRQFSLCLKVTELPLSAMKQHRHKNDAGFHTHMPKCSNAKHEATNLHVERTWIRVNILCCSVCDMRVFKICQDAKLTVFSAFYVRLFSFRHPADARHAIFGILTWLYLPQSTINVLHLSWIVHLHYLVKLKICILWKF